MEFSYLRKETLAKCPLCQTSVLRARSVYLHLTPQNRGRRGLPANILTQKMETGEVKNEGGGCFWEDFKQCI